MVYRVSQLIFEFLIRILLKARIVGKENIPARGPYIIASNHLSYLDPAFLGMVFRKETVNFMAKKELFDAPFFGKWVKSVRAISINRNSGVDGIREALKRLAAGRVVSIFPEGTRAMDEGELLKAKKGIGFLVAKAMVPVIPVYIEGTGQALTRDGNLKVGSKIAAYVGRVISPKDSSLCEAVKKKDYESVSGILMDYIAQVKPALTDTLPR